MTEQILWRLELSVRQAVRHTVSQSVSRLVGQSVSRSVGQSVGQSVSQVGRSVGQSVSQVGRPIRPSVRLRICTVRLPAHLAASRTLTAMANPQTCLPAAPSALKVLPPSLLMLLGAAHMPTQKPSTLLMLLGTAPSPTTSHIRCTWLTIRASPRPQNAMKTNEFSDFMASVSTVTPRRPHQSAAQLQHKMPIAPQFHPPRSHSAARPCLAFQNPLLPHSLTPCLGLVMPL